MRLFTVFASLTIASCAPAPATSLTPSMPPGTRAFRMGFSTLAPQPTVASALRSIDTWAPRSDAAIIHAEPKWTELLAGEAPSSVARREFESLAAYYRSKNLDIVVVIDVTNGVNRQAEARELVAAGRSIAEPSIQALYRAWTRAIVSIVRPTALGLAAETNLIRLSAPAAVYSAVVKMTAEAAADVQRDAPTLPLFVSVQVETAWGRLQGTNRYIGVEADFADFPFMQWVGLSSYPYLGGFSEPAEVPDDWYRRLLNGRALPTLITEGGWTSANVATITSSPEKQARWLRRQMQLADPLAPRYLFQLAFTDLDLVAWRAENDPQLLPFARLGLVDANWGPKLSLAVWDSVFAKPRER